MQPDVESLTCLVLQALRQARGTLQQLGAGGVAEIHAEHVTDISTEGDMAVSAALARHFRDGGLPAVVFSEESGRTEINGEPQYTLAFDDIDGTDNYHRGRSLLPHCSVVTLFDAIEPRFADALVAGVIEHVSGQVWHAVRGHGCFLDGQPVRTSGRTGLDRRCVVIVDHYSSCDEIASLNTLYPRSWVKDFGTSALHLAGVASGMFDAYVGSQQKGHELGAGYLLVREAGGVVCHWDMSSLDQELYDFGGRCPILVASTPQLAQHLGTALAHA